MNYEAPNNGKPVHGQIDPTSIPGSPDFVPSADFVEQLTRPSAMSHREEPEKWVVVSEGLAAVEEGKARRGQQMAVYGATGMALALGNKGILAAIQSGIPENAEVIHAATDQHIAPLAMILGGMLVLSSTVRAEIHRGRARRVRSAFDDLQQSTKPREA